ncbi:methionine--tRNA ligase [Brevibacterium casei]|uniref:Methionine--tRNA ligase n=2 Tax=Brevibacterium casei TaxID=33889 RepID=A0A2H1JZ67_9MICO|nr:methionine--tRNA ligase [Brevibacterium casei]KZE22283.1 methionine--tRNA ligase [Brevibacterium casei]MCT1550437.1 methionine--tRNA ligase [Brevibacterium casei]MCT1559151.1 methionine--tRNA ligase [Brevibacterium casei]MCT2207008.1 methionine--tRNA ligase [Brevibacterium casei]MDH5147764.1 methionine--tRNA ligase [Brevibacterium casei]
MGYYVTTAIAYPNGAIHIGHAYEYIAADTIARFKRLDNHDVFFATGTDEHGLKMLQAANRLGITPKELADDNAKNFRDTQLALGSTFDRFIRTTDPDHYAASQEIWRRLEEAGDIYLDSYSGWYSVRDEAFYTEDETEVVDGVRLSKETRTEVTWTEEESYFFRLSKYQEPLLELYRDHPEFLGPDSRRNEVASFVASGLKDLSISRTTFDWGVPVPGNDKHVMYVWIDALTNYLTAAGFPDDTEAFAKWWPADVHIIGKDIIRFHSVYWPAFLMSAGIELPRRVHAHGFLFNAGEKMSKSVGNVVDPIDLVDAFGLDTVRFFLFREFSYGQDGSYTKDSIITRKNADLANEYGNLAQRSLSMIAKNCDGQVPQPGDLTEADESLLSLARGTLETARRHVDTQSLHLYVDACWKVLTEANRYFSAQEPWKLKKTDPERMATVLWVTIEVVRIVSILIQPVMPESAGRILDLLGVAEGSAEAGAKVLPTAIETGTGAEVMDTVTASAAVGVAAGAGFAGAGIAPAAAETAEGGVSAADVDPRSFAAIDFPLVPGTPLPKPEPVFPKFVEETE